MIPGLRRSPHLTRVGPLLASFLHAKRPTPAAAARVEKSAIRAWPAPPRSTLMSAAYRFFTPGDIVSGETDVKQKEAGVIRHPTAAAVVEEIVSFFGNGEFFRSYDLAIEAFGKYPEDWWFAHRAVLSLANAGATELAHRKYVELGLDRQRSPDIRALLARLKKDMAFAETGARRHALLEDAHADYEQIFRDAVGARDGAAYYPGINAATLALLTGHEDRANLLAAEVLSLLKPRLPSLAGAPDRYWVLATALEANLVTGDLETARALVPAVIDAGRDNHADLASTGRQLERIALARGMGPDVLAAFRMPTIVHYAGHIISSGAGRFSRDEEPKVAADIAHVLDAMTVGAAYGSLAAGSDILFAEAFLRRGVPLNIVLPFNIEEFKAQSVSVAGESWAPRFHACIAAAKTVRYATEDAYLGDDHLFTYCSRLAMGLAVLSSRHMHAPLRQLVVWDGEARSGIAGTVVDMKTWQEAGHAQTIIRCGARDGADDLASFKSSKVAPGRRDTRAMLFGDIQGFSKLTDAQLPAFTDLVLGTMGQVLKAYRDDLSFVNTWGDGIFAVFADAGRAADCALVMQAALSGIDLSAAGLPPTLKLRLGAHLGPVYELPDPVTNRPNYYGAHVSRCARIEPITPEGCVYVTETFAAVLALRHAGAFTCDYVGHTDMAKQYGRLRMFLLRRFRGADGPPVLTDIERQGTA
jgi:class 3 adenylate cyclase